FSRPTALLTRAATLLRRYSPGQQHDDGVDRESDQSSDDGSDDADGLEGAADTEFDALGGLFGVPAFDRILDDAGDLEAEALGQSTCCGGDTVVDAAGAVRLGLQAFGEFADELPDAGAHLAVGVDDGLAQQLLERGPDLEHRIDDSLLAEQVVDDGLGS